MSGVGLQRVLKLRHVLALAFGAMIGWGWVALTGEWLRQASALGAVSAFVLGGVGIIFAFTFWLPVSNLWPQVYFAADRYTYAPLAGLSILAALLIIRPASAGL